MEKNWPGDEEKFELFCSLKASSYNTGTKHCNDVFAFWFDSNKDLHYPFLGSRVVHGSGFKINIHNQGQLLYRKELLSNWNWTTFDCKVLRSNISALNGLFNSVLW